MNAKELLQLADAIRKPLVDIFIPEIKELRKDMDEKFLELRKDMDERFLELHKEMDEKFLELRKEMNLRFAKIDDRLAKADERFEKMFELMLTMKSDISEIKGRQQQNDWMVNMIIKTQNEVDEIKKKLATR